MSIERKGYHGPSTFEGKSQTDPANRPPWLTEQIASIPEVGRRLLEEYSGVAPAEVLPHVTRVVRKSGTVVEKINLLSSEIAK